MADIARRSLDKFTYAPIRPSPADERSGAVERRVRGLDKVAFASALQARPDEAAAISSGGDGAGRVSEVLGVILEATAPGAARVTWHKLAGLSAQDLVAAGNALAAYRRERRAGLAKQADGLTADYAAYLRSSIGAGPILGPAAGNAADRRDVGLLNDKPFNGKFKLADLLDVLGIDVSLKDAEALALKELTSFSKALAKQ
jgi:hypothetical protein